MKTNKFSFDLPEELIAQRPSENREASRLMRLRRDNGLISHHSIRNLPELIPSDVVLVINDSKVRKARIYGETANGGIVEFLLLEERGNGEWKALASKAKRQKVGREYLFPGKMHDRPVRGSITGIEGSFRLIRFSPAIDEEYLDAYGHIPLPPYIRREDTPEDERRYQTVYAEAAGSVAAPTAGLHLTDALLSALEEKGVRIVRITLHVGLGTFSPIRSDEVEKHEMHRESFHISAGSAALVNEAKSRGRPVYAVGTTSVRTLESAWDSRAGKLASGNGETDLFIYPGYRFSVVDGLLTNFHTPKSSLLVLVSAFAGKDLIDRAYRTAVEERYRFFSYGDAMLIQ